MRPYVRVRSLTEEEYKQLKRMSTARKLAAGRVKRAQLLLLSNQGYRVQEIVEQLDDTRPELELELRLLGEYPR